ncbi:MAG: hypothetical protein EXR27_18205 [Betaproteobacteria bacterium]|nr:hypothetical protein [Betaproteobacteria bacterium]
MKHFMILLFAAFIAGCATIDFQPYEGKTKILEGEGGTKVVTDGIDFWANGTPPRKYTIIGIVTSEVAAGIGDEGIVRSAVAAEVTKQGGNAAIQINSNTSFTGVIQTAPTMYMSTRTKSMRFAIVKYIDQDIAARKMKPDPRWVNVGGNDRFDSYAEPVSIRRSSDRVKMWTLLDYKATQISSNGARYNSQKAQHEYDCKDGRMRQPDFSLHSGHMGGGEVILFSYDIPDNWAPIAPGTIIEDLWKFACGK